MKLGYLLNFGEALMNDAITRIVNGRAESPEPHRVLSVLAHSSSSANHQRPANLIQLMDGEMTILLRTFLVKDMKQRPECLG